MKKIVILSGSLLGAVVLWNLVPSVLYFIYLVAFAAAWTGLVRAVRQYTAAYKLAEEASIPKNLLRRFVIARAYMDVRPQRYADFLDKLSTQRLDKLLAVEAEMFGFAPDEDAKPAKKTAQTTTSKASAKKTASVRPATASRPSATRRTSPAASATLADQDREVQAQEPQQKPTTVQATRQPSTPTTPPPASTSFVVKSSKPPEKS